MAVKAPSGVTIQRNGNNYTVTWKKGASYSAQNMVYTKNLNWAGRTKVNGVGRDTTSKVITLNLNDYYPKTDFKLTTLTAYVQGKSGRRWSANSKKAFNFSVPPKPDLVTEHSSDYENRTSFAWSINWDNTGTKDKNTTGAVFTNYQWWTSLLKNSELDPEQVTEWQETGTVTDNVDVSDKTIDETEVFTDNYSYTRYFKLVARGPAGDSKPVYGKHVYAFPNAAKNVKAIAVPMENGSGQRVSVQWTADETKSRPIDSITVEYAIETPVSAYEDRDGTRNVNLSIPTISSWTTAATIQDTSDKNGDVDGTAFIINGDIPLDKCIFVRVVTKHDNKTTPSETVFVQNGYGMLTSPTSLAATVSGNTATITVNNSSALTASFVGIYYRSDLKPTPRLIGIWPSNNTAAISVKLPNETANTISFGAKTFLASYSPITALTSGVTPYALSNTRMKSNGIIWDDRPVPKPPSKIGLSSPRTGVVRITWDWTWTDANSVELSWADHEDAWESTDGPQTHVLENTQASAWNVAGLDAGVWYFRIRLFKIDGDATTYGTYSDIHQIKLASSPATPVLTLSPSIISPDGKVTCYWAFTATDGDEQVQADICEATLNTAGEVTYGRIVSKVNNEQFKTLSAKELGWSAGDQRYLAVRIITASGEESNNWSVPKPVRILDPVVATVSSTSLETITIIDDSEQSISHQQLSLTEMPLSVSASGAGEGGTMTYILERATDYHVDRPDETDLDGFEGETVAIIRTASNDISIDRSDLIGSLDDGAAYNLVVVAQDSYGQVSNPVTIPFEVHWEHQAVKPSAAVLPDEENLVSFIMPIQPTSGYASGDTCDIYRLSIDKPELIVENASFGTQYVDPYPALGNMGGHRIVYKTVDGDYITTDNEFAWTDYADIHHTFATVIDFGDDRVILPYDISLSNKWSKDFTQTKYLGGSIEGDWNPAVERSGSINTRVSVQDDPDLLISMRRLSTYAGICHVRTPDGSSFAANVNVNEDREEKKINMVASFSLDITRIDSSGFDGITYEELTNGNE